MNYFLLNNLNLTIRVLPKPCVFYCKFSNFIVAGDDIDVLVNKIENRLKQGFVIGDEVNLKADKQVFSGSIVAVHDRLMSFVS